MTLAIMDGLYRHKHIKNENGDTESTEYISFNSYDTPIITIYDNQIYIRYHVSANYSTKNQDSVISGFIIELLVPLDLINN